MNTPPSAPGDSGRRRLISVFLVVVFLYWVGLYTYVPTLPIYVRSKIDDLAMVGTVLSMYGLWQAIIRLPLGIASDWIGRRKPFILGGLVLVGLGAWLMAVSDGVGGVLVGRAVTGLAAGTWVPLVVVFNSLFPSHESVRATSILMIVGSVARMLATGLNGTFNDLGGYSLAFYLAVTAALIAVLVTLTVREAPRPPRRPSLGALWTLVSRRDVLGPALLNTLIHYGTWASTFGFIAVLARELGASDQLLSLFTSMNLAVGLVGNLSAAALAKRLGGIWLSVIAIVTLVLGLLVAMLAPSMGVLFVAQLLLGLSAGVGIPTLMGLSIRHVDDVERASAMGLHQSVYALGMFGGPWLSGIIANALGLRPMFGITAGMCLVLGLAGAAWVSRSFPTGHAVEPVAAPVSGK